MNYFRYKQFNKDVITVAVGYYLRYALSYRDNDAEGNTLDIWLRKQRDNHSEYVFIKRLIKQFGKPQQVITDQEP
uniref:DDE-type integrase/transposase/recombinase n=1 Tax=Staphylococcus aureus TaxID=1280 RepID=UPI002042548B